MSQSMAQVKHRVFHIFGGRRTSICGIERYGVEAGRMIFVAQLNQGHNHDGWDAVPPAEPLCKPTWLAIVCVAITFCPWP